MKAIETIKAKVKILKGSTLCPEGKIDAAGILNDNGYTGVYFPLPNGGQLNLSEVSAIDQVEVRRGWESPKEIAKVSVVSLLSIGGGVLIVDAFMDTIEIIELEELLAQAVEANDFVRAGQLAVQLADLISDISPVEYLASALVEIGVFAGPAVYGTITLSKRTIGLVITTNDNQFLKIECPEYFGTFLLGFYGALNNGSGQAPKGSEQPLSGSEQSAEAQL